MTYYIVWNEAKTEGFVTVDAQLAYEVRKGSSSNCVDGDGHLSLTGIAFIEDWGDENCTIEQVGPDPVKEVYIPTEQDKAKFARNMQKLHMNSTFGKGLMKRDLPNRCPECGSIGCNGECFGDDMMGSSS